MWDMSISTFMATTISFIPTSLCFTTYNTPSCFTTYNTLSCLTTYNTASTIPHCALRQLQHHIVLHNLLHLSIPHFTTILFQNPSIPSLIMHNHSSLLPNHSLPVISSNFQLATSISELNNTIWVVFAHRCKWLHLP